MKALKKNNSMVSINEVKQEQWSLMPFGDTQYWITYRNNGKTAFIATVEDSGDDERNRAVATLLSKAPQLLELTETLYDDMKATAMEKTVIFYMIKKLLNEIKENGHTGSIRNAQAGR